jgi:hypothetical protein
MAGFGLIALGQLCYLLGGLQFGGRPFDLLLTLVSLLAAAWAAFHLLRASDAADATRAVAWGLTTFAAAQGIDFPSTVGSGVNPFTIGFALLVAGATVAAVAAWLRSSTTLRVGAGIAAAGTATYVLGGALAGLNVFSIGVVASVAGWILVALA